MFMYLLISAIVGGLIGWTTNVLAVKLIFRPYKPYKLLGIFVIQGLIPKRRGELAQAIGEIVEKELLSSTDIFLHLQSDDIQSKLSEQIIANIRLRVQRIIPPFIPQSFKEILFSSIDGIIEAEVERFFKVNLPSLIENFTDTLPIAQMVEAKVNQFELEQLENLVLKIAKKELKHIEYLGGVLGIFIGLVQGILLVLLTL